MTSLRRTFSFLGLLFLLVGIGLAALVGFHLADDYRKIVDGERATGIVVAAGDDEKPTVEFRTRTGERIRVEGKISVSPSPYEVGERIGVFYDPADPAAALIDAFAERWFIALLLGGFAVVFLLVGGTMFLAGLRRVRRWRRLLGEGARIEGRVAGFEQNRYVKINGKHPWQVLVDWTDPRGDARRSRSQTMRRDPSQRYKVGDRVTVIADAADPKIFWIDLEGRAASAPVAGTAGTVAGTTTAPAPTTGFGSARTGRFGKSDGNPVVRRR